ncbi:MAG: PBP1A family penicillin-binding protein [Gemmatimonadetes bacterium]|nr:PBP1A family penicillin-binding protein [Gemmatimonadota bacterium]
MAYPMNVISHRGLFLIIFLIADVLLIVLGAACWLVVTLPRLPDDPDSLLAESGINIYAASGELLYTVNQRVGRVGLDEVHPHFVQAVLSIEDADFYHHRGYSIKGMVGAFLGNIRHWGRVRGGSTITQQIVKNIFLTREKFYVRKLKEILLATQLEALFERHYGVGYKDRLLEIYINGSFYGANAYGLADAAQTYFGKRAADLTLLEAAILAGLPNAPSVLNPFRKDQSRVLARATLVLNRMQVLGFIRSEDVQDALASELQLVSGRMPQNRTPYFVESVKAEVTRLWGAQALSFGGLDIYTTLDLSMQQAAERAVARGLADLDARLGFSDYGSASSEQRADYVQGALICLDPRTGYVKAMVGGRDIFISYYNRATQARRQPGSGFKPFVYLAAFESGAFSPISLFNDSLRTYRVNDEDWSPKNFADKYLGLTTAANALVKSANATSVQIAMEIGPERIVDLAQRLGIQSRLRPYPSIALGAQEVTLLDMAIAYGAIASYGFRVMPTFIARIEDATGQIHYEHRPDPRLVIDPEHAVIMVNLMQHVVNRGTGRAIRAFGFHGAAAGKTGTTNDNTDAWFTGFTPDLVASVWIGFDNREGGRRLIEKRSRRQITGGSGAAPIWAAFMKSIGKPSRDFITPTGVAAHTVNLRSGIADTSDGAVTLVLPEGVAPNIPADTLRFLELEREATP